MKESIETIRSKLVVYGLVSVLCFIPPLLSVFIEVRPESETIATWFQRSGAIMVVMAIWVEFKLLSLNIYISPSGAGFQKPFDTPKYFATLYGVISFILLVAAIVGTVIWGYGDLLF